MTHPNPDPLYVPELEPNDVPASGIRRGIGWAIAIAVVLAFAAFALSSPAAAMSEAPQNVGTHGPGEWQDRWHLPALGNYGGSSPVIGSGASLPTVAAPAAIAGTATWYCGQGSECTRGYGPLDMVAAIDPTTGIDKGTRVRVTHDTIDADGNPITREVSVRIVDVCACAGERIIDLTSGAFLRLAPTSVGVIPVAVETLGKVKLPDTSTVR